MYFFSYILTVFEEKAEKTLQIQGIRGNVQKSWWKIAQIFHDMIYILNKKKENQIMAAKKTAATKTAPVQTEEIVKVEETVNVEKKPAAKKAT